jgi:predicted DNA-binding helix-hairpin-helix protein
MDVQDRLAVLADNSQYDLSCACGTRGGPDHRRRGPDGLWLYPTSLPRGGQSVMLKTLMSNACTNDCRYCPLRADRSSRRCSLAPNEVAEAFMAYLRRGDIFGLFLSSGVVRDPDHTMDLMTGAVRILRQRHGFDGYVHLKVIPGCSDAAVEEALGLANTVSVNVEAPTRAAFRKLSDAKDYDRDIVRTVRLISRLTGRGNAFSRVRQMTQFVVGAADETDRQIVDATFGLYRRLGLARAYFSAYQRGLGDPHLPGESRASREGSEVLTREHRLYQADWLMRKYGFDADEIPFEPDGNLSLEADPKELWARRHPERFPVDVNRAGRRELLRVPGLGPVTVKRIIESRHEHGRLRSIEDVGRPGKRLRKAERYLVFGDRVRRAG